MTPATRNDPFVTRNDRESGPGDWMIIFERCQAVKNDRFLFPLYSLQCQAVRNNRMICIALRKSCSFNNPEPEEHSLQASAKSVEGSECGVNWPALIGYKLDSNSLDTNQKHNYHLWKILSRKLQNLL
jgi:hypothetical protein